MDYCIVLLLLTFSVTDLQVASADGDGHFVNAWAAEIPGGEELARDVAEQHGYNLVRSLENLPDIYLLEREDTPHRSRRSADHHTRKLSDDDRVVFVEQQRHNTRVKRGFVEMDAREVIMRDGTLDDPEFPHQWYLIQGESKTSRRDGPATDLGVVGAWKMGYSGEGVTVTVIDDGVEGKHPDLKKNYDPVLSYDFNDNDADPSPRYDPTNENKHGTRCAGEIAMAADNGVCGVGVAYNARIGGIRILDGAVTDHIEGQSLAFNPQNVSIYSCSWGPNDDGRTMEGPGRLTLMALQQGVKKGRGGLGSIFIWASGNGGRSGDNCNADGYTSRPETITVSSASQDGKIPFYSERCASTLTTTYSSGSSTEGKVVSADLRGKCTDSHSGTSAAAPLAAGIVALALEANPTLTYRDVQHAIVHTSTPEPLLSQKGWYVNGHGYCVNNAFGFGLMNATALVEFVNKKTYRSVGELHVCKVEPSEMAGFPLDFVSGQSVEVEYKTDGCAGQENEVNYIETLQVCVTLDHQSRGNIYAEIQTPENTTTCLMQERPLDSSSAGLRNWCLTSTHSWGERSRGTFKFRVADRTKNNMKGSLKSATLVLYGTKEQPEHLKQKVNRCGDLNNYADTLTNIIDINRDSEVDRTMQTLKTLLNSGSASQSSQTQESLNHLLQELGKKPPAKKPPVTLNKPKTDFYSALKSFLHP